IDLDVELKAGQLVTRKVEAKNLSASIRVQDSVLTVDADSGEFSGGHFDMNLTVDAHEPQYTTKLEFNIDALELDQIPQLRDKDLPIRGQVDVEIDLKGQGKSVKRMLAKAAGSMSLSARDAIFSAGDGLDFLTHSIVTQILGFLDPKSGDKLHEIECGEIGFRVVDGEAISRDTIVLQLSDVIYLVAGGFRFDDETLDIAIKPIGRGIGVVSSVLSGNEFFRVRGTLQDPKPEPDLKGVFWTGLQAWLAPMTGGASILAPRLWDWWQNQDACDKAKENLSELLRVDEQTVLKVETKSDDTPRSEGN
ncbi:MAG: AsmA family protein, partial [bacterium]